MDDLLRAREVAQAWFDHDDGICDESGVECLGKRIATALADTRRAALLEAAKHRLVKFADDPLSRCACGASPDTCDIAGWWEQHIRALAAQEKGREG